MVKLPKDLVAKCCKALVSKKKNKENWTSTWPKCIDEVNMLMRVEPNKEGYSLEDIITIHAVELVAGESDDLIKDSPDGVQIIKKIWSLVGSCPSTDGVHEAFDIVDKMRYYQLDQLKIHEFLECCKQIICLLNKVELKYRNNYWEESIKFTQSIIDRFSIFKPIETYQEKYSLAELLEYFGWKLEANDTIRHKDGSFAIGETAKKIIQFLKREWEEEFA